MLGSGVLGTFFPKAEYEARWARVHAELKRRGYETAVVFGRSGGTNDRCGDVLYLTNFFSTASGQGYDSRIFEGRSFNSVLLQLGQAPELHADEPGLRAEIIATDRIVSSNRPFVDIAEALKARKIKGSVALVGSDVVPLKYWRQMQRIAPDIEWEPEDDLVLECRLIKSPLEQEALRIGGATAARSLTRMMEALIQGRGEAEARDRAILAELDRLGVRTGYAGFWVAPKYTFLAEGRTVLSGELGPIVSWVHPGHSAHVRSAGPDAYLVGTGALATAFEGRLDALACPHQRSDVGGLAVFHHLCRRVTLEEVAGYDLPAFGPPDDAEPPEPEP